LQALTAGRNTSDATREQTENKSAEPETTPQKKQAPNPMVGVLERHERISNRLRSGTNKR
jgi:hypothetical protein